MDKDTRNLLFNTTQATRRLLEEEFSLQLEGTFDVHADGRIADQPGSQLSAAERLVRCRIVEAIQHRLAIGESAAEAVRGFQSEAVFTFLNRLAALKMMEARALVLPCVSQGDQSQGFKEFSGLAPGLIELPDKGYRLYLECLFDEIGREVGVLFDRTDAASQLWPRRKALEAALAKLNTPELASVWAEDETIGWIYQYYNDPEERKQMREESSAPRNSRELAVRNQFFTPLYVVEFLTDNTLGRIWYEMTKGQTRLKDQCRYLVRRPTEIFLGPASEVSGQHQGAASAQDSASTLNPDAEPCTLSQEDLLRQPVHVPHRPLKDPREIRMIDPACGSMHFGLYAFDLFTVIYDEAWEMAHGMDAATKSAGSFTRFVTFVASFADKAAFLREVPRLTVEHNIHGIDIDPRAAQIAGLALWLRAQRGWQALGLKSSDRPPVRRSNIVCAEPMPGERGLLREFVDRQFPQGERSLFQSFLENVWDKMRLAGEAGSLLKIEEEIRSAIEDARDAWRTLSARPIELFSANELNRISSAPELTGINQAVSSLTAERKQVGEDFWERIEERIYAALRDYAEQAENGGGFQRRLFAEDAARGFAFIDVCRKRYDVVVMNPPFGTSSELAKDYIFNHFEREKIELGSCFIGAHLKRLNDGGLIGVIANRTMLFSRTFEDWRRSALCGLLQCADLGQGVLDAVVETAAFTITARPGGPCSFYKLLDVVDKATGLQECLAFPSIPETSNRIFDRDLQSFGAIDGFVFAYWLQDSLLKKYTTVPTAGARGIVARSGLQTCDNFRFLRLFWEIPLAGRETLQSWPRLTKGGEYQPFWSDIPLVIHWAGDGYQVKAFVESLYCQWSKQIPSVNLYRKPGATYTERTTSATSLRVLPENCLFDKKGPFIGFAEIPLDKALILQFIALTFTTPIKALIESSVGLRDATASGSTARDYLPSLVERLCFPPFEGIDADRIHQTSLICVLRHQNIASINEASSVWRPIVVWSAHESIGALAHSQVASNRGDLRDLYDAFSEIEHRSLSVFDVTESEAASLDEILGESIFRFDNTDFDIEPKELARLVNLHIDQLVDVAAGSYGLTAATLKQAFVGDRIIELLSFHFRRHPLCILEKLISLGVIPNDATLEAALTILSIATGSVFGRWDIRYATGERPAPELSDPFAPLPVCPPGMLQGDDGLPLSPEAGRRLRAEGSYPLDVAWDGILVDDPNHPADVVGRVQEALQVLWKDRAEAIEQEACEILGTKSLRDWFRKPTNFFTNHLKRYSKSRRQAPIYWPLSSPNGLYTIWLYYHRLTADTLFTVLRDHVKPKLEYEERQAFQLRQEAGATPSTSQRRDIAEAEEFVEDLRAFKAELDRVAPLFRPDLNDGVIINHAPLWRMIGLPKWRKDCQATWNELVKGDYDWAHLALHLWPERVIPKCAIDRSLAIAHGLDAIFWREDPEKPGKWVARKVTDLELRGLIAERTSAAVKAAVESLVGATSNEGATRRGRKGAKA